MRTSVILSTVSLMGQEVVRRTAARLRSAVSYRIPYSGSVPASITMVPEELRPADPAIATALYSGQFSFGDQHVSTKGGSPFAVSPPSEDWEQALHGFRWLRHLNIAGTDLARANAQALVMDWIEQIGSRHQHNGWDPNVTASRLIAWLKHIELLLADDHPQHGYDIMRSIMKQVRYLQHVGPYVRDGYPRLHGLVALAFASLCLPGRDKQLRLVSRDLNRELERQILADGGHISRNPVVLLELLGDLLPLRQAFSKLGHSPSRELLSSIDKMMAALRFFRHANGDLAQFNGTGATPHALLAVVLGFDDSRGKGLQSAAISGYERLSAADTTVIVDTGKAINLGAASKAMAGCLSFELASGSNRFVMNCGAPDSGFSLYAPYARATAAHSTLSIDDQPSSLFTSIPAVQKFLPSPLIMTPQNVSRKRESIDGFDCVDAFHDGYGPPFGLVHRRQLQLSRGGDVLNGIDQVTPTRVQTEPEGRSITLRFHLPPSISASMLSSGKSILLAAQNGDAWTFTCVDAPISLAESIHFSGPGQPRKTEQIVVSANSADLEEIRWTFERGRKTPRNSSRKNAADADLLDGIDTGEPR